MRTLQASANYYDMSVNPTFSAYLNTTQTLSNGAYTKVIFDTVDWDTTGAYNTTTGDWTPSAGVHKVMFSVCGFIRSRTTGSIVGANHWLKRLSVHLFKDGDGFLLGDLSTSMNMRNSSSGNYPWITQYAMHRTANLTSVIQTDGSHSYAVYVGIYCRNYTTDGRVWGAGDISSDYTTGMTNRPWITGGEGYTGTNATDAIQRSYFQAYTTKPNG
jgi:hypothetical protein